MYVYIYIYICLYIYIYIHIYTYSVGPPPAIFPSWEGQALKSERRRDFDASCRPCLSILAQGKSQVASRKVPSPCQPGRRSVDPCIVTLDLPPAVRRSRRKRHRRPRHLARSRTGSSVLCTPLPESISFRISAPTKSKPRAHVSGPGHLRAVSHKFVHLLIDTHTTLRFVLQA